MDREPGRPRQPELVSELLEAGARVRDVQLGAGSAADLRTAAEEQEAALRAVMRKAEKVAAARARRPPATLERVRETLHAAALDADLAEQVRRGVLVREQRAVGFPLGVSRSPPSAAGPPPRSAAAASAGPAAKANAKGLPETRSRRSVVERATGGGRDGPGGPRERRGRPGSRAREALEAADQPRSKRAPGRTAGRAPGRRRGAARSSAPRRRTPRRARRPLGRLAQLQELTAPRAAASGAFRYWWTKAIAMLPSPTAAATRFTGL